MDHIIYIFFNFGTEAEYIQSDILAKLELNSYKMHVLRAKLRYLQSVDMKHCE